MTEVSSDRLKLAVESQHGGAATFVESIPIDERQDGKAVWQGSVHVFDLDGHSKATKAYAWSSPVAGTDRRRFYAVLHLAGIRSPQDAVRAAIVAEHRVVPKFNDDAVARSLRNLPGPKDRE